jgi:hypothetical protein
VCLGIGRIVGLAADRRGEAVQPRQLVGRRQRRIVGDVVDRPGEGVIGGDVRPERARQQQRADGKVLVGRALA